MASILLDDFPDQALVGIDAFSLTTRRLRAVTNLPPGPHFFWASESTKALRSGTWVIAKELGYTDVTTGSTVGHVQPQQMLDTFQLQWNTTTEVLEPSHSSRRHNVSLVQLSDVIFDYTDPPKTSSDGKPLDATKLWPSLVSCISQTMLDRVVGGTGLHTTHTTDTVRGRIIPASEAALNASLGTLADSMTEKELAFSFIPGEKTYDTRLTGAELTASATDSTAHLLQTATRLAVDAADVVGELQFALINGTHLGNEACLQVWWHMTLQIFLHAHTLALRQPRTATLFLRALAAQIQYDAAVLGGMVVEQAAGLGRQLRLAVIVYGRRLREELEPVAGSRGEAADVLAAYMGLCDVLEETLDWDMSGDYVRAGLATLEDGEVVELEVQDLEDEDERGEYAAVVLDLDAEGRPSDMISWD